MDVMFFCYTMGFTARRNLPRYLKNAVYFPSLDQNNNKKPPIEASRINNQSFLSSFSLKK